MTAHLVKLFFIFVLSKVSMATSYTEEAIILNQELALMKASAQSPKIYLPDQKTESKSSEDKPLEGVLDFENQYFQDTVSSKQAAPRKVRTPKRIRKLDGRP